jgi:hypothetical protein
MSENVPESAVRLAESVFYPTFVKRCSERGYILDEESMLKQAMAVVEGLTEAEEQAMENALQTRKKLAKRALFDALNQDF